MSIIIIIIIIVIIIDCIIINCYLFLIPNTPKRCLDSPTK